MLFCFWPCRPVFLSPLCLHSSLPILPLMVYQKAPAELWQGLFPNRTRHCNGSKNVRRLAETAGKNQIKAPVIFNLIQRLTMWSTIILYLLFPLENCYESCQWDNKGKLWWWHSKSSQNEYWVPYGDFPRQPQWELSVFLISVMGKVLNTLCWKLTSNNYSLIHVRPECWFYIIGKLFLCILLCPLFFSAWMYFTLKWSVHDSSLASVWDKWRITIIGCVCSHQSARTSGH